MRRSLLAIAAAIALVAQSPSTAPVRAASEYFLPAPAGTTLLVTQGNVAANGSQYAWDFAEGTAEFPVVASRGGTVIGFRSDSTNTACRDITCWKDANYVLVDHGDGTSALYLHLATGSVTVIQGQTVGQGAPLGRADSTGFSYGTHLHFMVEKTPTARTAAGWWWTQSLPITFADAGAALEGVSYVSANQPAVITTATPAPTPRPTPKPTPKPTPLRPPAAPTALAEWVVVPSSGPVVVHYSWHRPPGPLDGYYLFQFGGVFTLGPGETMPSLRMRCARSQSFSPYAGGATELRSSATSYSGPAGDAMPAAWICAFNAAGGSPVVEFVPHD